MMGVLLEMRVIPCLEEVLVEINHLTINNLKFLEKGLMDHLMKIWETMDPQVIEDIHQDKGHQEKEDLQDHQEADHLVHLETLDPQEIKDLQVPLDHEDIEDPQDTMTCKATRPT